MPSCANARGSRKEVKKLKESQRIRKRSSLIVISSPVARNASIVVRSSSFHVGNEGEKRVQGGASTIRLLQLILFCLLLTFASVIILVFSYIYIYILLRSTN